MLLRFGCRLGFNSRSIPGERPPEVPAYEFSVGGAPVLTGSAPLDEAEPGDTYTVATRATWLRDGAPFAAEDGNVTAGWYETLTTGERSFYQEGVDLTIPADPEFATYTWIETLTRADMSNEEPVQALSAVVGPVTHPPVEQTQADAIADGLITVSSSAWEPDTQTEEFKVVFAIDDSLQNVNGAEFQWTTDAQTPARADKWETMIRVGDLWEMSYLNPDAIPYIVFSTSQQARWSLLRFRWRNTANTIWSAESAVVTVAPPEDEVTEPPEPPIITPSDLVWKMHIIQDAATYADPAKRGKGGAPFQFMYGMDLSPQDDNFVAIIEDVAGPWRSLGKDGDGNYTWQMAPCRGMQARGGQSCVVDPENKLRWLYTISSDGPGTGNPGIYLTTDYFETATRVLNPGGIGGGGGSTDGYGFSHETLKFSLADPDYVYYIATNDGNRVSGGCWRSPAKGDLGTWEQRCAPAEVTKIGKIWHLSPHPTTLGTLYASGENGLYRSTDGGQTWAAYKANLPAGLVTSVDVDPQTPANMRVCVYGVGVYESTNGGGSWSPKSLSGRVAASYGRVFSSQVPGHFDEWMLCGVNSGGSGAVALAGAPRDSAMYVGSLTDVTRDLGAAGNLDLISPWHGGIRLGPVNGDTSYRGKIIFRASHQTPDLWVGHSQCTFWQNDGTSGNRHKFYNAGIGYNGLGFGQNNIGCIHETPDGEIMVQASFDYGCMISFDSGKTFVKRTAPRTIPGGNFASAVNPAKTGHMICVTGGYGARWFATSTNYGQSWTEHKEVGSYQRYRCVGWNNTNTSYCYNDKYFSRNRGVDWVRWNTTAGGGSAWGCTNTNHAKFLASAPSNGNVVWAKSANGQQIWRGVLNAAQAGTAGEWTWTNVHTLPAAQDTESFDGFWPAWNDAEVFFYYRQGIGLRRVDYNGGNVLVTTHGRVSSNIENSVTHVRTDPNDDDIAYVYARYDGLPQIMGNADIIGTPNAWVDLSENIPANKANSCMEVLRSGDIVIGGTGGPQVRQGLGSLTNSKLRSGGEWEDLVQPRFSYLGTIANNFVLSWSAAAPAGVVAVGSDGLLVGSLSGAASYAISGNTHVVLDGANIRLATPWVGGSDTFTITATYSDDSTEPQDFTITTPAIPTNTITMTVGNVAGTYYGASDGSGTTASQGHNAWGTWTDQTFDGITCGVFSVQSSGRLRMHVNSNSQIPGITSLTIDMPGDYTGPDVVATWNGSLYQTGLIAELATYMTSKNGASITVGVTQTGVSQAYASEDYFASDYAAAA